MNILIVTQYFYPENFKINDIACELVRRGNRVDVATGLPNYPHGEIFPGYEEKWQENYHGVNVYRTKTRPRHQGSVNLFRNYLSFMLKAKKTVKKLSGPYDVIFCYEPSPIFQLTPAISAKKRFHAKLVLMCCDQWPESLKARGVSGGIIFNLIHRYCRSVLKKCDHVLNVSPSFIEYNHKVNGVPKEKMSWMIQPSDDSGTAGAMTEKDTVDLVFAGNIGRVQNVEDIVKAYSVLKHSDLRIHVFGDGSRKSDCEKLAEECGVTDHVIFYGKVTPDELKEKYRQMDACLLTLSGKTEIGNTIPSKLANYFSLAKPVIAAIGGDSQKVILENGCGLCCEPDDYEKLAGIIDEYYLHKADYDRCGVNARKYFEENCTLDKFTDRVVKIFQNEMRG